MLLLTAVTGAWAQTETPLVTIQASENSTFTSGSKTFNDIATVTITGNGYIGAKGWESCTLTVTPADGVTITSVKFYGSVNGNVVEDTSSPFEAEIKYDSNVSHDVTKVNGTNAFNYGVMKIEVFGTAEPPIVVEWNAATKTGTFAMPGSDVVLTPIYAKAAAFATTGTEPEVKPLLPEAAEGVIAGTDASLIAEGTGTVAFAGTSTDVTQGTLMYAIGTSATEAPAPAAFSATVPTAKDIADDGATVYVWYYIQGADAPEGVAATLDNTFDNTEPACLTVQVLTNKFDIQFNAANANTIEAGKATVTVGGTDKTGDITEGKLQGVKMGSEVKVKANTGYKFRKVEVKKKASIAEGHALTSAKFGEIVGSDGKAYAAADKDILPSGVTAAALVCYVDGNGHGLALALSDEGDMDWNTAKTTCAAHTPAVTGATWKLASKSEMNLMINAAGNYAALRDGFSAVGGTNMIDEYYWLSDESSSDYAENFNFSYGSWSQEFKDCSYKVRACLAF